MRCGPPATKINCLLRAFVLPLLLALYTVGAVAQKPTQSFVISIKAPQTNVHSGDRIMLNITIENKADTDLAFGTSRAGGRNTGIIVKNADGKVITHRNGDEYWNSGIGFGLRPGERTTESVDLAKQFELMPGTYSVQVRKMDQLQHKWVSSNVVSITVAP